MAPRSGLNTILELVVAFVLVTALVFVAGVTNVTLGPMYNAIFQGDLMDTLANLGWGQPGVTVLLYTGIGLIGIFAAVLIWWIIVPITRDTRQETRRP